MDSFRVFLDNLCSNTGIEIALIEENGVQIYSSLHEKNSETTNFTIILEDRRINVYLHKKYENSICLLKYIIKNKYKEICCVKENLLTNLLSNKEISTTKIEKNLNFFKKGVTIFAVNVEGNKADALEIIKQLYLEQEVISFIHKDNIVIVGIFEEIEDHAKSIKDSVVSHLYVKCYIGFGGIIYDAHNALKAYKEATTSIMLGKKFCLKSDIFSYDKMMFERIVFNINPVIKQELINKFKAKFDAFDRDTIITIEEFIDCGLNISDTSKKLYVHRNTLIYRLDKIKKETGFDIRKFTDATVFTISFLIWKESCK